MIPTKRVEVRTTMDTLCKHLFGSCNFAVARQRRERVTKRIDTAWHRCAETWTNGLLLALLTMFAMLAAPAVAAKEDPMRVRIIQERKEGNVVVFHAINPATYPQTVDFTFTRLQNFRSSLTTPFQRVVPPKTPKTAWLSIKPADKYKNSSFGYHMDVYKGDITNTRHDNTYAYRLPFAHGTSHQVGQGYNGGHTHSMPGRTHAIDFTMPKGTRIHAARPGVVIDIKQDSSIGGASATFIKEANYVSICHDDGTFAMYSHLKRGGVMRRLGERVRAGDAIGISGNTGWSTAPHLHFEVFFPRKGNQQSIPTKFLLNTGPVDRLEERKSYTAHHR